MESPQKYKAVLLDWDQTIGDWHNAEVMSLGEVYDNHHLAEWYDSKEDFMAVYLEKNTELWSLYGNGKITKDFLQRERFLFPLLHALNLTFAPKVFVDLADKMGTEYLQLTNKYFHLLPDADELVRYLAAKYPLTILSNGFKEVQYYKIETSGLKDCFRHILVSEEVGINKPQTGIFEEALRRNGVKADEAVMIGDNYSSDISGAKAAGIDQIWLTMNPGEQKATYIVSSLKEIMGIL